MIPLKFTDLLWLFATLVTLEALLAMLFLWITHKPARLILWFFLSNLVSGALALLPGLWIPDLPLLLLVVFCLFFLSETLFLWIFIRKHYRLHVLFGLTFALNFFSTIAGSLIYTILISNV